MRRAELDVLLEDVQGLQSIMVDVSTGGSQIKTKEQEYKELYWKIDEQIDKLGQEGFKISNPNSFESLWDWYGYWSGNLRSYQSRREYVRDLYANIVDPIRRAMRASGSHSASDDSLTREVARRLEQSKATVAKPHFPTEIHDSLEKFQQDHPNPAKTAFLMMRFSKHGIHQQIVDAIRETLDSLNINAIRADDKEYHDDLYYNILTYIYGSGWGIAIFDRIESEQFNPNVALEVGFMLALNKPVCLLKDKTLTALHADLIGKFYKPFDPHDIQGTIPQVLTKWLLDRGFDKR